MLHRAIRERKSKQRWLNTRAWTTSNRSAVVIDVTRSLSLSIYLFIYYLLVLFLVYDYLRVRHHIIREQHGFLRASHSRLSSRASILMQNALRDRFIHSLRGFTD